MAVSRHADYHARCSSYVRITEQDLNGPFGWFLQEVKHPLTEVYPGVSVGECDLAAGHPGPCEMFVDSLGQGELSTGHWIVWQRPTHRAAATRYDLAEEYQWVRSRKFCDARSPYNWLCGRPAGHDGGHAFTVAM